MNKNLRAFLLAFILLASLPLSSVLQAKAEQSWVTRKFHRAGRKLAALPSAVRERWKRATTKERVAAVATALVLVSGSIYFATRGPGEPERGPGNGAPPLTEEQKRQRVELKREFEEFSESEKKRLARVAEGDFEAAFTEEEIRQAAEAQIEPDMQNHIIDSIYRLAEERAREIAQMRRLRAKVWEPRRVTERVVIPDYLRKHEPVTQERALEIGREIREEARRRNEVKHARMTEMLTNAGWSTTGLETVNDDNVFELQERVNSLNLLNVVRKKLYDREDWGEQPRRDQLSQGLLDPSILQGENWWERLYSFIGRKEDVSVPAREDDLPFDEYNNFVRLLKNLDPSVTDFQEVE